MTSKIPFYVSVILLVVAGIALSVFRHQNYGVPWTPGETRQVWDVEARIEFNANGNEVKLPLPPLILKVVTHLSANPLLLLVMGSLTSTQTPDVAQNGQSVRLAVLRPSTTKHNFWWTHKLR